MKTFLIKTVEQGKVKEIKVTAMSFSHLVAALKKYKINPLWDRKIQIKEERDE